VTLFSPVRPAPGTNLPADSRTLLFARVRPHALRMPASDAPAVPANGADRRRLSVGLMGGSFNPAHAGHRHVAELAFRSLGVDEVWWLVSPQNPLKSRDGMAPYQARIESARRVAHHPRIRVRDIEMRLGTHFTADTLVELRRRCPRIRFVWIMGADNLIGFHRWERWSLIFHSVAVAVFDRPSYSLRALASRAAHRFGRFRIPSRAARTLAHRRLPAWVFLHTRRHPASATRIREAAATGG
jgi:nicotinate-nucleotide adenylyltransferase